MKIHHFLCCTILAIMLVFSFTNFAHAQGRVQKVKAVFLFKFASYITWPNGNDNLTLCTYGGNPFGELLRKISTLQKKRITVEHIQSGQSPSHCHIVYVAPSVSTPNIEEKSILAVSDKKGFAQNGGAIEIRAGSERVGLIINTIELDKAGLKASSRLLDLAELIR